MSLGFSATQIINIWRWNSVAKLIRYKMASCLYKNFNNLRFYLFSSVLISGSRRLKVRFHHFLSYQQWSVKAKEKRETARIKRGNRQRCLVEGQTRYEMHIHYYVKWEFYYKFILYLSVLIRSCRFTRSWPVGYICEFAALKSNRYNSPWANDPVILKRVKAALLTPYPSVAYLAFAFRGFHNSWFFGFLWKKKYTTGFKNSCLKQQCI